MVASKTAQAGGKDNVEAKLSATGVGLHLQLRFVKRACVHGIDALGQKTCVHHVCAMLACACVVAECNTCKRKDVYRFICAVIIKCMIRGREATCLAYA